MTFFGTKSAGKFLPLGLFRTLATNSARASGLFTSVWTDTKPWLNKWLSGADPFARLMWMSSLSGPSRSQASKPVSSCRPARTRSRSRLR
jgi:hypothetical protein